MIASKEIYVCIYAMGISIPAVSFIRPKRMMMMLLLSSFAMGNCHARYDAADRKRPYRTRYRNFRIQSNTNNNYHIDVVAIAKVL
jgi:hypothetical protein